MKGLGKTTIELLKLARRRGYLMFSDMKRNRLPFLIQKGLMQYSGVMRRGRNHVDIFRLTEKGREFIDEINPSGASDK